MIRSAPRPDSFSKLLKLCFTSWAIAFSPLCPSKKYPTWSLPLAINTYKWTNKCRTAIKPQNRVKRRMWQFHICETCGQKQLETLSTATLSPQSKAIVQNMASSFPVLWFAAFAADSMQGTGGCLFRRSPCYSIYCCADGETRLPNGIIWAVTIVPRNAQNQSNPLRIGRNSSDQRLHLGYSLKDSLKHSRKSPSFIHKCRPNVELSINLVTKRCNHEYCYALRALSKRQIRHKLVIGSWNVTLLTGKSANWSKNANDIRRICVTVLVVLILLIWTMGRNVSTLALNKKCLHALVSGYFLYF